MRDFKADVLVLALSALVACAVSAAGCYQHAEFSGGDSATGSDADATATVEPEVTGDDTQVTPETEVGAETATEETTAEETAPVDTVIADTTTEVETVADTGPEAETVACPGAGDPCEGVGECGQGRIECGAGGAAICSTNPQGSQSEALVERCDDLDNDCDGSSDEGLRLEQALFASDVGKAKGATCGVGACGGGRVACSSGDEVVCDSEDAASAERCNEVDDDCDGTTDEGFESAGVALGETCGPCRLGTVVCASNGGGAECSAAVGGADRPEHVGEVPTDGGYATRGTFGVEIGVRDEDTQLFVLFADRGAGTVLTGPGSYPLAASAADRDFATCTTCAMILEGGKAFFATGGTVVVTELDLAGHHVTARVVDAVFAEVTVGPDDRSTPVPDGDTWCLPTADIVVRPECTVSSDCSADPTRPICEPALLLCGECLTHLDCSVELPVCGQVGDDLHLVCNAGESRCDGDDARENGDDGPLGATALVLGDDVEAAICGRFGTQSGREQDWYVLEIAEEANIEITMSWAGESDIDFALVSGTLETIALDGATLANPEVLRVLAMEAGTYYVLVRSYEGSETTAVPYTIGAHVFSPECSSDAECQEPGLPACDKTSVCVACTNSGYCSETQPFCGNLGGNPSCGTADFCVGDDTADDASGANDDGPSGATEVTAATTLQRRICSHPAEADWYEISVPANARLGVELSWVASAMNLDMALLKLTGEVAQQAVSTTANPETLTITPNTTTRYYLAVWAASGAPTNAEAYTLKITMN